MEKDAYVKFQKLQTELNQDPEYLALEEQRRKAEPEFLRTLNGLSPERRQVVIGYLGILEEKGMREIELTCFLE